MISELARRAGARGPRFAVGAALGVTLVLGAWNLGGTLPYLHHPDEATNVGVARQMVVEGDPNPRFFNYPGLSLYVQAGALVPFHLAGRAVGAFDGPEDVARFGRISVANGWTRNPAAFLWLRAVGLAFGAATVAATYALGARATRTRWGGVAAAVAVAVSPLLLTSARTIGPDVYAVALATTALLGALVVLRTGSWRAYAVAGVLVGLAAGAKYNVALVGLAVVAAHLLRPRWWSQAPRLALAGVSAIGAFVAVNPYAVLDPTAFADGIRFELEHYSTGHAGAEGGALGFSLRTLWDAHGPLVLLGALGAGAGLARARTRAATAVLLAFVGPYLLLLGAQEVRFARNVLPVVPAVVVLAVVGVASVATALAVTRAERAPGAHRRAPHPARTAGLVALAAAALLAVPMLESVRIARDAPRDDRAVARAWIREQLPPGTSLVVEAYGPWVDPHAYRVEGIGQARRQTPDWYRARGVEYLVLAEGMFGRFYDDSERYASEIADYERLRAAFPTVAEITEHGTTTLVLAVAPP